MNYRLSGMQVRNEGFTLVELIVVIVILGILSVSAIPKFVDLKSEARIATLKSMMGSIKATNNMVYAKAIFKGANTSYTEVGQSDPNWYPDCRTNNCVEVGGVWVYFKFAYLDRNSVVFALDGDIDGRKTVESGGKTFPDRCGLGQLGGTTCNAKKYSLNYLCSSYKDGEVCTGHDFCQCRLKKKVPGSIYSYDSEYFIPRGSPYKDSKCYLKYTTAEEFTGKVPIYELETSGC